VGFPLGKRICLGLTAAASCLLAHPSPGLGAETAVKYAVVGSVAGSGGQWDQAIIDQQTDQLLLAQSGVTALDLRTEDLRSGLVSGGSTHDLAALPGGLAAVDDAASREIQVFRATTGKVISTIRTGTANPGAGFHALDALIWDPSSGLLIAINGDTGRVLFVDLPKGRVTGVLSLGSPAESGVADGSGDLFVNVNSRRGAWIAVIDSRRRRLTREIPLEDCAEATGIAFDRNDGLIVDVCTRGLVKFIRARDARQVASVSVGKDADDVMFDPGRRRVFVPAADGTLSVLEVDGSKRIRRIQMLATPVGTRLGALDARTGRLYLPSARFGPPRTPNPYPSVIPGSFRILIVAPQRGRSVEAASGRRSS
jgi:DNA-binding beta-propeller fold protein YncE